MICFKCSTPIPDDSRFCLACGADVSSEPASRTSPVATPRLELERLTREATQGEYEIERELGRGGMAVVYLARDLKLARRVAIKVLPPDLGLGGSSLAERFMREARTAAALDHPHIIPIYRVGSSEHVLWYAMKYVEGRSLADVLETSRQLPIEAVRDIIRQAAEALSYAHRRGVIHRDIKPANIMLDEEGWVLVTDFGIAKALGGSSLTGTGRMIGTPYFMSPEQCEGKELTGAADQYSLAVVTYQLLTGHLPFEGDSVVEIVKKQCFDPPPPIEILRPDVPVGTRAAIARALAKRALDRFPSVLEFAGALGSDAALPEAPKRTSVTAVLRRLTPTGIVDKAAPWVGPRRRRRPILMVAGLLTGLATAATGTWFIMERHSPSPGALGAPRQPAALPGSRVAGDTLVTVAPPESSAAESTADTAGVIALVNLPPRARVFLDGQRVTGPVAAARAGTRWIRVLATGYRPWQDSVTVRTNDTATLVVTALREAGPAARGDRPARPPVQTDTATIVAPPPTARPVPSVPVATGFITVTTSGAFGSVYVDGRLARAQTPLLNHPVPPGAHTVRVERTGYATQEQRVTVSLGDTIRIRFTMRPAEGGQRDSNP